MAKPVSGEDAALTAAGPHVLEQYLSELRLIRTSAAGGPETSYYPALSNLFNAVGKTLKPKVRCVMNLRNLGAGMPDGGLFTGDQFQRQGDELAPKEGQLPARGAIEAKGTKPNVKAIAATQQVKDYLNAYGIVIVTNLREFLIVERGGAAGALAREAFSLAADEQDFWNNKAEHPCATAQEQGARFFEFIKRACLHAAPLSNAKDVAWFLASYARDALARVEARKELPALAMVRNALEEALGMKFTGEKGEHFFRSSLVQTLFYGVFSAWVLWHKNNPRASAKFDWRAAEWTLHVPFIRTLYRQVADPNQLGQLGLVEVLDWTAGVLNRVDRSEFFGNFQDEKAVQYFYEPFLEAYDPELRKELGVWYTPPEIVKYQVSRVDTVLREELGLADGLADENVIVLDPCCGTAAYVVEVLKRIAATLRDKGGDALVASDLKKAAMQRVFGFEILPAPFVVSHLQLGMLLQAEGAPLDFDKGERAGVYLTNALTGWEPPKEPKTRLLFPEMEEEREAAENVKRGAPILVILGNPPYNGYAGVAVAEERTLTEAYRTSKKVAAPQGQGLNDLYVRFFRMAERRIVEMNKPAKGVVCFISNYSWLDGLSFTGMRERYLEVFDRMWVDCLNGDKYKTGKLTPDGKPDPSIFSTESNREGIQVGAAIALLVCKEPRAPSRVGASAGGAPAAPYVYRRNLPHIQNVGRTYFITFCTKNRWVLPENARELVLQSCIHDHGIKASIHVALVMPDHVHLLLTPLHARPGFEYPLADILRAIKSASSHKVNRALKRSGAVWEEESFDRYLRSEESLQEKGRYICANPERKGLVSAGSPWQWLWREWVEGQEPRAPSRAGTGEEPRAPSRAGTSADEAPAAPPGVQFRHFWGKSKRADIAQAADQTLQTGYERHTPALEMGLPFMPSKASVTYFTWPVLPELFPVSFPGVKTSRDAFLVDVDKERLTQRLKVYFDPKVSHDDLRREYPGIMQSTARYKAEDVRDTLRRRGFLEKNIVRYCYRPFDIRWLYWEPETKLLDEKREDYFPHVFEGNIWFFTTGRTRKDIIEPAVTVSILTDLNFMDSGSRGCPLYLSGPHVHSGDLFAGPPKKGKIPNLSDKANEYLAKLDAGAAGASPALSSAREGARGSSREGARGSLLFFHAVAVLHAPVYREENAGALRQDWPRVPLPDSLKVLEASAGLGEQVAALLDTEADVPGVTTGKIGAALKTIGLIMKSGGGQLDAAGSDLAVNAGWGHAGKEGVTMPGKGKLDERSYLEAEAKAIEAEEPRAPSPVGPSSAGGAPAAPALGLLGAKTYDVWLNRVAYWRNIPEKVWKYHIGGYQAIKKWLSYREEELLGRALKPEEAREVMNMARRIAALILLQPALDENYRKVKAAAYTWPREPSQTH